MAIIEWDEADGKGIDDLIAKKGAGKFLELLAAAQPESGGWKSQLIRDNKALPRAVLANPTTAFREAPDFAGVLAFNEFSLTNEKRAPTPWNDEIGPWTDNDDLQETEWCNHEAIYARGEVVARASRSLPPRTDSKNAAARLQTIGRPHANQVQHSTHCASCVGILFSDERTI